MGDKSSIRLPHTVDKKAVQVCSIAGINLLRKEKARFVDLAKTIQFQIKEISNAKRLEEFASVGLLGANLIKASCEAFIDMAGTLGELAGVKGAGKASSLLGAGSQVSEFWIQKAYGGQTDAVSTGTSVAKAAMSLMPKGKTPNAEIGEKMTELHLVKIDILNAAMKGDNPKVLRETFLSYGALVTSMVFTALKKETAEKLTSSYMAMVKAGSAYSENLEKSFDQRLEEKERLANLQHQRGQLIRQLGVVMAQIKTIDLIINDCRTGSGLAISKR